VDNVPYSFAAQISNGYPIVPFYNYKEDKELLKLEEYLKEIENVEDVTEVNRMKFKLHEIAEEDASKYAKYCQDTAEEHYGILAASDLNEIQKEINALHEIPKQ
jgi:hypothetical protein